jgi:hypothetical protein
MKRYRWRLMKIRVRFLHENMQYMQFLYTGLLFLGRRIGPYTRQYCGQGIQPFGYGSLYVPSRRRRDFNLSVWAHLPDAWAFVAWWPETHWSSVWCTPHRFAHPAGMPTITFYPYCEVCDILEVLHCNLFNFVGFLRGIGMRTFM